MSYDLTLFKLEPGADPEETLDELLESWDEELPADEVVGAAACVDAVIAALEEVFPGIEPDRSGDGTSARVLLDGGAAGIDVYRAHSEVEISYGGDLDAARLLELVAGIVRAAGAAGQSAVFDPQLGRLVELPADETVIVEQYGAGVELVDQLAAERFTAADLDAGDGEGRAPRRPGLLRRLFGGG